MSRKEHLIVGRGITGPALAWQLQRRYGNQIQITILEKENRFGGWLPQITMGTSSSKGGLTPAVRKGGNLL